MTLQIPKDIEYLKYCEAPHNRYELAKQFSSPYSMICFHVKKLVNMQLLFVVKEENGRGPGKVKYYLTTDKGRAIVRGHMEATRE
jgi:DNA-binding PadR family transcriptional regulator